jgi:hypothetical protein
MKQRNYSLACQFSLFRRKEFFKSTSVVFGFGQTGLGRNTVQSDPRIRRGQGNSDQVGESDSPASFAFNAILSTSNRASGSLPSYPIVQARAVCT